MRECFRNALNQAHLTAFLGLLKPMFQVVPGQPFDIQADIRQDHRLQMQQIREQQGEANRLQQQLIQRERDIRGEAMRLLQQRELLEIAEKMIQDNPDLLRKKLREGSPLLRFVAIQVISKRRLPLESDLIEMLNAPNETIRQASRNALIHLARGTDFGPLPGFSQKGIARSVDKWQHWLALQKGEPPEAIASALKHSIHTMPTASPGATRLCNELVKARGEERTKVLERLRDTKGIDNSDALALAIPKLGAGVQRQVREALAQRMTRMKIATLRDKLEEDNPEVRRAAALACGRKKATEMIPELLKLLDDPEGAVIQSARRALKDLTGEDFGPDEEAGRFGRVRAAAAWRKGWAKKHNQ